VNSESGRTPISLGIDLGTTNCAASVQFESGDVQVIPILQQLSELESGELKLLPSFLYLIPGGGQGVGQVVGQVVGEFGRLQLKYQPGRVIQSAKSWLAHKSVSALSKFLPFASEDAEQNELLSPVEVSAAYLAKIREAVERALGISDVSSIPTIVITVPASFNELACNYTVEAAKLAGFGENIRLLEEPQAALYRGISKSSSSVQSQKILVCDVGGGTTDLSLFDYSAQPGLPFPKIVREKIGDHLLLGGDNLDMFLSNLLAAKFAEAGISLSRTQQLSLQSVARDLKESVLANNLVQDEISVAVAGAGSSLFASAASVRVKPDEIRAALLEEFFPVAEEIKVSEGVLDFGLPFPIENRLTAHISKFVSGTTVDKVLFVGGTLIPSQFREAILKQISLQQSLPPIEIEQTEFDTAVATGAALFGGRVTKSEERIRSGKVKSLYLKLRDNSFLCVIPFGMEEGSLSPVEVTGGELLLKVNSPVRFELYSSNEREISGGISTGEGLSYIAPMKALLSLSGKESRIPEIPAQIEAGINDLGRVQIYLKNQERGVQWKLEFNLDGEAARIESGGVKPLSGEAANFINAVFGRSKVDGRELPPKALLPKLEESFGNEKREWSPLLLRSIWSSLERGITRRDRSREHELTWLALAGYCLRPGLGVELDSERIERLWRIFNLGLAYPAEKSVQAQWALMWRRVSLGLDDQKQQRLFNSLKPKRQDEIAKLIQEPERLRLLAALERVTPQDKLILAEALIAFALKNKRGFDPLISWCVSRLVSRYPLSGAVDKLIPAADLEKIVEKLIQLDLRQEQFRRLPDLLLALARVAKEERLSVSSETRARVRAILGRISETLAIKLDSTEAPSSLELQEVLGDELPPGLRLKG